MSAVMICFAVNVASLQDLVHTLQKLARREGLSNKEGIKIQGDGRLKWSKIISIMDTCRKAGFRDVGFAPPPDLLPGV